MAGAFEAEAVGEYVPRVSRLELAMHRRDLLRVLGGSAAASLLAPLTPAQRLQVGRELHAASSPGAVFGARQLELVAELCDLIIPRTDTPGATDVGVPAFVERLLAWWDTTAERDRFLAGLADLETRARGLGVARFADLSAERKLELLTALDRATSRAAGSAEQAWARLKQLTVYGYFTSRRVQEEVLHSVIIPGRFDGCVPVEG